MNSINERTYNKNKEINSVLIVGANSSIGSALIKKYFDNNFTCFGTYNNSISNETKKFCDQLLKVNLSDEDGINKLIDFTLKHKPMNIVYLPGYVDQVSLFSNSIDSIHKSFNINLFGFWLLISESTSYMKAKNYGRFLSISSIGSKFGGGKNKFNYTTSKKLLEFFPRDLKDLAKDNIFVNNIICGATDSPIFYTKKEEDIKERIDKIPIKRLATANEIAIICYRLCSMENTFQTLSNTTIAGGE